MIKKKHKAVKCLNCGKEFSYEQRRKYCSNECAKLYYRKKHNERTSKQYLNGIIWILNMNNMKWTKQNRGE